MGSLLEKLSRLSPERLAEVEDFVDFLGQKHGIASDAEPPAWHGQALRETEQTVAADGGEWMEWEAARQELLRRAGL